MTKHPDCEVDGCLTIPKCVDNECVKEGEMDSATLKDTLLSISEASHAGMRSGLAIGRAEAQRESEAKVRLLTEALEEIAEEAEDRQDVIDGDDGRPRPDAWMRVAQRCREALAKVTKGGSHE